MQFKDLFYFGKDYRFHFGDVSITDGRFECLTEKPMPKSGCFDYMIPGLVDIHLHGAFGEDFSESNADGLQKMARFLAKAGTTSFCAATMALPEQTIASACRHAAKLRDDSPQGCARLLGVMLEGPFLSGTNKGAQNSAYLQKPDLELVKRLQREANDLIRIVCVAPELEDAMPFIQELNAMGLKAAAAHTQATYEEAARGFDAGISHVTHLFNAMLPLLHREPGLIGAAMERENVSVELICDGVHVHPAAVRAAFKLFGASRICLVSDAMAACGLKDGVYALGGQKVFVCGGRAALTDGTIAGSVVTLFECVKNAIAMGISAEDAVRCASANPARVMGADDIGSIAVGKRADFLVCGSDWTLKSVHIAGVSCY